jgi:uncharacterized membrane protein YeaQ/YmgE (transglycosylase-associated protein family)
MSIENWGVLLVVAALCTWCLECAAPDKLPAGLVGGVIVLIFAALIGCNLLGQIGTSLAGGALLPTVVGAVIWVFGWALISSLISTSGKSA